MSESKIKSVREQVEARLKELGYWPCPPQGIEAIVAKVNAKVAAAVTETMKSWSAVGQIVTSADPAKEADRAKPATAGK